MSVRLVGLGKGKLLLRGVRLGKLFGFDNMNVHVY